MTTLKKQINEYNQILGSLKPKQWEIEVVPKRNVRDIIAHMVGWEKEAVEQLKKPKDDSYSMGIKDYQKFNDIAVRRYKILSTKELMNEWEKWQKLLDEEIIKSDRETLDKKSQLFDWIIDGKESNHYECHLIQLRKLFN